MCIRLQQNVCAWFRYLAYMEALLYLNPHFFNHYIEAFNKMLAVLCELIDGTVIGVRFDFVPSERLIVGENI